MLTFNCSGLNTTQDQLVRFLQEVNKNLGITPIALLLQECFMTKDKIMKLKLPGYRPVAASQDIIKDGKPQNSRGSAILVAERINIQPLKEKTTKGVELIGVKLVGDSEKPFKSPIEIWSAYCGPNKKEEAACVKLIKELSKKRQTRILLAGDLNNNLSFATQDKTRRTKIKSLLEKIEEEGKATILNSYSEATTKSGTLLDLGILLGSWETTGFAYPVEIDLTSYHYPVIIGINLDDQRTRTFKYTEVARYKRDENTGEKLKEACKQAAETTDKHTCHSLAEKILEIWHDKAKETKRRKNRRKYKHWWNDEIEKLYKEKQRHLKEQGTDNKFHEIDKELHQKISDAKNESFREFATQLDHKQNNNVFCAIKHVGERQAVRIDQLTVKKTDGTPITDIKSKAEVLSTRYQTPLGSHPKKNKPRSKYLKNQRKKIETDYPPGTGHIPFTMSEVRIAREEIASNKVPGPSRIRKEDFVIAVPEIDKLVRSLGNMIGATGEWPQAMKKQIVRPIPKDDQALDEINEDKTRPISLLEILDKWVQRMIYNRITHHMDYNEIQAGYVLSCDNHTSLFSDFVMNHPKKDYNIAVFTDISKAFDSVPLPELVDAIWNSKIEPAYKWALSSFVEGRKYCVEIRNMDGETASSKWRKTIYGTPQGSVLGPLLWNLFFNPLLDQLETYRQESNYVIRSLNLAFADDLTIIAAAQNPKLVEKYLEECLAIFKNFLDERNMQAAPHKLKVMCLDPLSRDYSPTVKFGQEPIEVVAVHKFLGVHYDKNMTFNEHWQRVTTAVANRTKTMLMLRGAKWGPTQATMMILHQAYVESRVSYGAMAWIPFLSRNLKTKIDVYLRRSVRVAMGLPISTWNEALALESQMNTTEDLAIKSAISLYTRINPESQDATSLVKKYFNKKAPLWTKYLKKAPKKFWEGAIQTKLKKRVLATDLIQVHEGTLETQEEALVEEEKYTLLLYTDASVDLSTNPPGQAVIAHIWYEKPDNLWQVAKMTSAHIGSLHSSYSAEAVAITEGLKHKPDTQSTDRIGIFTDSLSNVSTIRKGVAENKFEQELFTTLATQDVPVTLHHVRSHMSNQKNKEADALCNIRRHDPTRQQLFQNAGQKSATTVKQWTKDWLQQRRTDNVFGCKKAAKRNSQSQNHIINFMSRKDEIPKNHKSLPRGKGVLLSKARTNRWTNCSHFLHFIKKRPSQLCSICGVKDTTEHVLNKCSMHEEGRELMMQKLCRQFERPTDLLLSKDAKTTKELADFLLEADNARTKLEEETRLNC